MATEQGTAEIEIISGPSKDELVAALFEGGADHRRSVFFAVNRVPEYARVVINGIRREDGSGESWLFSGYLAEGRENSPNIEGYFSTRTGRGWLRFSGRE